MNQARVIFPLVWWAVIIPAGLVSGQLIERSGQHIRLLTDLESAAEAESLVASFDAAVPQWAAFWQLPADAVAGWKVEACVMREASLFRSRGLLPDHIPNFPFGYAYNDSVWVLAQPSEYYTRHLLLHEGVHSLAFSQFGGAGPTWFMEGSAELLATHQGIADKIQVNRIPPDRESAPYWGRFKLIKQLRQEQKVPSLEAVMRYAPSLSGNVATYGWSWAASMLLSEYPEYRDAFIDAARNGKLKPPRFNRDLYQRISQKQWPVLAARWRVMCRDLDYGFDWSRERLAISVDDPLRDSGSVQMTIAADRGWQSAGIRVPPGTRIDVEAAGQIVLDTEPKPWISHPTGVTIQYHRGRPLGQLLACVLPNASGGSERLESLDVVAINHKATLLIDQYSWVLFRVNDAVGDLENNSGAFEVRLNLK